MTSADKRRDAGVGSDGRERHYEVAWSDGATVTAVLHALYCTPGGSLCIPGIYIASYVQAYSSNRIDPCRAPHPPTRTYHRILPARRRELWGRGVDAGDFQRAGAGAGEMLLRSPFLPINAFP